MSWEFTVQNISYSSGSQFSEPSREVFAVVKFRLKHRRAHPAIQPDRNHIAPNGKVTTSVGAAYDPDVSSSRDLWTVNKIQPGQFVEPLLSLDIPQTGGKVAAANPDGTYALLIQLPKE